MAILDEVRTAVSRIRYPGYARDIGSLGFVREVTVQGGHAHVTLDLPTRKASVAETLLRAIDAAVSAVEGVTGVTITKIPGAHGDHAPATPQRAREPLPGVRRIVAVASGKGGVGKSTVAVNLAIALGQRGLRVGLLDADVHGPSVPLMTGTSESRPHMVESKKIVPVQRHGIALVSMGFFLDDRSPVIWRGPMVMSIVRQFLRDVLWGELDVLVVDLPPGTGDAQLTLLQEVPIDGGVIVTTPQDVALQDVRRGISMFATVQTPVLGIVENMSGYVCPHCNEYDPIFGAEGGRHEAAALDVPFLGRIPLSSALRASMDRGMPLVVDAPADAITQTFADVAERIVATVRAG